MVLFPSAAHWYSPPARVTHCINVSNDTATKGNVITTLSRS
jgi:hypothetical protein